MQCVSQLLKQSSGCTDLPCWLYYFSLFRLLQEIVNILIYSIKYSEIILWMIEEKIFCVKTYYERLFKIVQARYKRKFNFNTFPNRNQIFQIGQKLGSSWYLWQMWGNRFLIIWASNQQEECAHIIKNFACRIQLYLQLNVDIWSIYFWAPLKIFLFMLKTKGLQILKCYSFTFQ